MQRYFIKTPWFIKKIFSNFVWSIAVSEKVVYLTFDDGPHPSITPFVLDELKKYRAEATFFCIGKNVANHQDVYQRILQEGHAVGNHTQNHLNGWKVSTSQYVENIKEASQLIRSNLFRPPYGRIKNKQAKQIRKLSLLMPLHIIMWDVLSADFDTTITPQHCLKNVLRNTTAGSIVVFHDSEKAFDNLRYALPLVLKAFNEAGYRFEKIKV